MTPFIRARTLEGRVTQLLAAEGSSFETTAVPALDLSYEGIPADRHSGLLRKSGPREPWYPRGTEMRNERQLSILGQDELLALARDLDIPCLAAEWIGGNLVLEGVPHVSLLPPRTLLMFDGGVTIRIDGDNGPCRKSGAMIARHVEGRPDLEFAFVKIAQHRRGVLGWVERAGRITAGETVRVRIWEQQPYPDPEPHQR
ncbi:molybdenum cofactor sulfurase [Arsenicitalea aurantiaca]|uniref:Molybdenum cofactor sulfurase n=1 Tax=Arsenicitalea aurantiaca TaxID=1783274 RepID=A0A433XLY9_9HYPH|nr:molybdenum cofactor sulfurase [Arsenicitalea aurantiaca]RUT35105.1 molybdenum cofactor sulfurase [Arsenicitalea aurantiaca]